MGITAPVSPRTRKILYIILGCALLLHVASDIGVYVFRAESISTTPDPLDYRLAALNLLEHGEFSFAPPEYQAPQLLRTPVYPALLAATYLLDGKTGLVMILLQSLMLVVMGWLLFQLLRVFQVSEKVALVLVTLYLFEPLQWLYTLHTMTETLASFLVLALTVGALVGKGVSDNWRAALYGIGLGLAVLVKPSVMMWVPFLLLLTCAVADTWRARLTRVGIVIALFVFTLSPWMIRNYGLTGHAVVSSSSDYALVFMYSGMPEMVQSAHREGILPATYWNVVKMAAYNGHTNQIWYAYTTNAYDDLLVAGRAIRAHLDYSIFIGRQITYAPHVWFGFWTRHTEESYGHQYDLIANFVLGPDATRDRLLVAFDFIAWSVALALFVLGAIVLLRDRAVRWLFLPLLAMVAATVFVNYSASWVRMLLPMYPMILVGIGRGVECLLQWGRGRRSRV